MLRPFVCFECLQTTIPQAPATSFYGRKKMKVTRISSKHQSSKVTRFNRVWRTRPKSNKQPPGRAEAGYVKPEDTRISPARDNPSPKGEPEEEKATEGEEDRSGAPMSSGANPTVASIAEMVNNMVPGSPEAQTALSMLMRFLQSCSTSTTPDAG